MGRCFGYMIANFIFTKWSVNKIVIKKINTEMTKTETNSTMICRGPTMSECKEFVCFFRSINDFQLILKRLYTVRSLDVRGQIIPFTYCFRKKGFRKHFFAYKGHKKRVFLCRLYASVLWGIRLQICLK